MDWENMDDREQFLSRFIGLCELFNIEASEFKTEIYFRALSRFDVQAVVQGIDNAIVRCKFFPKPVELIELIQGSPEDVAEIEASKVWEAISRVGGHTSVVFDNPVTAAVVEHGFGGWVKLCSEMKANEEKWFRKDFIKTFSSFARQNVQHFGELSGRAAIANEAHFQPNYQQTALIGDTNRALNALEVGQNGRKSQITMLVSNTAKQLAVGA
ncbi:DUF6475 domain-containing protein [Halodesulfovibrio aestuarii]|uniref:DUF6475 domain-containing protein n=1 Tax=Halodesulfovibrio aestuarii TaxID=126333 RepID=UPI003D32CF6F